MEVRYPQFRTHQWVGEGGSLCSTNALRQAGATVERCWHLAKTNSTNVHQRLGVSWNGIPTKWPSLRNADRPLKLEFAFFSNRPKTTFLHQMMDKTTQCKSQTGSEPTYQHGINRENIRLPALENWVANTVWSQRDYAIVYIHGWL